MNSLYLFRRPSNGEVSDRLSVVGPTVVPRKRSIAVVALVFALIVQGAGFTPQAIGAAKKTTKTTKKTAANPGKKTPKLVSLSQNQARKSKVRKQRIAASGRVSALKDEDKRVEQNLQALSDDLKDQNAALGSAKRALAEAEIEVVDAKEAVDETSSAIEALGGQRQAAAIQSYVDPPASQVAISLTARSLSAASSGQIYRNVLNRKQTDDLDKLRALEEDRGIALSRAKKAEKRRAAKRKAADARLRSLVAARSRTQDYSNDVEDKLERALSEADSLAQIDKELAGQILQQQGAIARQLAAARRNGVRIKDGKIVPVRDFPIGTTNGIKVAASIRGKLASLLAAAAGDGVSLSGGGYRSAAGQIALRRAHCGSSTYAIYQMRSSGCRPPTARPGSSQHERGLAIDFTQNGRGLTRSTSGYRWLKANAHKYGFYNLPSEPWHWSTTGR